jgi:threonine dehydratase
MWPTLTRDDFTAARARIAPYVRRTPTLTWSPPDAPSVTLKLEYLQVGGSFKARGACNRLFSASADEVAHGVVTASGGNHGLGVAYAAHRRGCPATVYLPETAPRGTEERLLRFGARAIRFGRGWDDAWAEACREAERTSALALHPFEDPRVVCGQGTIALELVEQAPESDLVVVAIGGGGLIAGVAAGLAALGARTRVVGVEPEGAPSMLRSLEAGRVAPLDEVRTIAGTLAPRAVGPEVLALVARHVARVVLVTDEEMRAAMRVLWHDLRILVEPAGAAAVAALLHRRLEVEGARAITILVCGANVDPSLAATTLAE